MAASNFGVTLTESTRSDNSDMADNNLHKGGLQNTHLYRPSSLAAKCQFSHTLLDFPFQHSIGGLESPLIWTTNLNLDLLTQALSFVIDSSELVTFPFRSDLIV